jgi:MazG family protein
MDDAKIAGKEFEKLVIILDTLRGEEGCPWDKKQDEKSIMNYFLEEVYEAVDAIISGNARSLAEELGDVLLEVVFLARIFKEYEKFTISEVVKGINRKMIRRHPHVFGRKKAKSADEVLDTWNRQKKSEKSRSSFFEGITQYSPSLLNSFQIGLRASGCGFDWKTPMEALQKVKEEISELEKALGEGEDKEVFDEIGDMFFAMSNVSRLLKVNPEIALKKANEKFQKRFQYIEKKLKEQGKDPENTSLEEMDEIWEEAKTKKT